MTIFLLVSKFGALEFRGLEIRDLVLGILHFGILASVGLTPWAYWAGCPGALGRQKLVGAPNFDIRKNQEKIFGEKS